MTHADTRSVEDHGTDGLSCPRALGVVSSCHRERDTRDMGQGAETDYLRGLYHSHGGTGLGSAHSPILDSRAAASNRSSIVSPGAYFRYHQRDMREKHDEQD